MYTFRALLIALLIALDASGTASARLVDRQALLALRQSSGQDETRTRGVSPTGPQRRETNRTVADCNAHRTAHR